MDEPRMPHVTLTGDRTGQYVVTEERPDGSLVVSPDASVAATLHAHELTPVSVEEFEAAAGARLLAPDDEG